MPFPFPGDLPDLGIEPVSSALAGGFFFFFNPLATRENLRRNTTGEIWHASLLGLFFASLFLQR